MFYFKGCTRIFSKYYGKENFIYLAKKNILESIQEISNKTIRDQVEKKGIDRLHHFFSPDYLPFLVDLLKEKFIEYIDDVWADKRMYPNQTKPMFCKGDVRFSKKAKDYGFASTWFPATNKKIINIKEAKTFVKNRQYL